MIVPLSPLLRICTALAKMSLNLAFRRIGRRIVRLKTVTWLVLVAVTLSQPTSSYAWDILSWTDMTRTRRILAGLC